MHEDDIAKIFDESELYELEVGQYDEYIYMTYGDREIEINGVAFTVYSDIIFNSNDDTIRFVTSISKLRDIKVELCISFKDIKTISVEKI